MPVFKNKHTPGAQLYNLQNDRDIDRALTDAGYMPLKEYVHRWGEYDEESVLSSRVALAAAIDAGGFVIRFPVNEPDITQPQTNAGKRADD